ncbi:MAG: YdcF family protein, partial [Pedobacter sp.]
WELRNEKNHPGRYEAVIILSGFMGKDQSNNSLSFGEGADRLTEGLILYRKGIVKNIIISGGSGSLKDDTRESVLAKAFLVDNCGIPDSIILIDSISRNTYENAVESKKLMEVNHIKSAVMITSAWHMRRASGCFKKTGLNVGIHPTDGLYQIQGYTPTDLIIPNTRNISRWEILMHEIAGVIIYKLQGYI